jgi:hypothetical protein
MDDHLEWKTFTFLHICQGVETFADIEVVLEWGFPSYSYLRSRLYVRGLGWRVIDLPFYRNSFVVNYIKEGRRSSAFKVFVSRLTCLEYLTCYDAMVDQQYRPGHIAEEVHHIIEPFLLPRDLCDAVGLKVFIRKAEACEMLLSNIAEEMFGFHGGDVIPNPFRPYPRARDLSGCLIDPDQPEGDYYIDMINGSPLMVSLKRIETLCQRKGLRDVTNLSLYSNKDSSEVIRRLRRVFIVEGK